MPTAPPRHKPQETGVRVHKVATRENYGQGRGGRPWRRLRAAVLDRDSHLCQPCRAAGRVRLATQVDHVKPIARGGSDDPDNLQAICKTCHDAKTARDARGLR